MVETVSPLGPARKALAKVRVEVKDRIGKEGGNLNEKLMAQLDVIESTLNQIEPLGGMLKVINQQTEISVAAFRQLSQLKSPRELANGDDGTSETKGE